MGAHLTGADRSRLTALIADRYRAGDSIRGLAAHTGRSYSTVRRLLLEANVTMRRPGRVR